MYYCLLDFNDVLACLHNLYKNNIVFTVIYSASKCLIVDIINVLSVICSFYTCIVLSESMRKEYFRMGSLFRKIAQYFSQ